MVWSELELRWVVLGLGLLVILGVFLAGLLRSRSRPPETARSEPEFWPDEHEAPVVLAESGWRDESGRRDEVDVTFGAAVSSSGSAEGGIPSPGDVEGELQPPHDAPGDADSAADEQRVVSLRLVAGEGRQLDAERTVRALSEAGLQHGPYEIFHYCEDRNVPESGFSVANLVEPGSFDLTALTDTTLPGMTFFLILPGSRDPVERFDRMIGVACELCQELDAELLDESGSSWTFRSERYVREELIEYRRRQSGR